MENTHRSETKRIATIRSSKWAAGAAAMLLSASLVLSACGGSSEPVVEATVAAATVAPANTPEPAATEAATPASDAATTPEVDDSEEMTGTDAMTETEGVGDSETLTGTGDMTGTESMTGTEGMTGSEGMTGTESMTGTEGMTGTGAVDTADTMPAMGVAGVENQYVRATTLLDYDFENMGGEVSGDLEDLLIDLSTGRVLFAAIEYGGVLDLGDKDIVVPLNAFAIGSEGELVLNIDESALESYPDVGNDWPDVNDPLWDDDVNTFWGDNGIELAEGFDQPSSSVAWASDILGHNIADLGFGAGSVLDMLVNLGTAQAPYLIVDYGEGLDTDPYIIPLSAYDVTDWRNGTEFAYGTDFTPDILENAPRFDQDAYPEGSPLDNDFGDRIESAWNDLGFSNDLNRDGEND